MNTIFFLFFFILEGFSSRKRRSIEQYIPDSEYDMERIRRQSQQQLTEPNQNTCKSDRAILRDKTKKRLENHREMTNQRREELRQRHEEVVGATQQRLVERKQLHGELKTAAQQRKENLKQRHEEIVGAAQQKHKEIKQKHLDTHHQRKQEFRQMHEDIVGVAQQRREELMSAHQEKRQQMLAASESRLSEHHKRLEQRIDDVHDRHEQFVGATRQRHEELRSRFDEHNARHQQRLKEMRSRFRTRSPDSSAPAQKNEFDNGFSRNFEGQVEPRAKRSTQNDISQKSASPPSTNLSPPCLCSAIENLKIESKYNERLQTPEAFQYIPELQDSNRDDVKESSQKYSRHCQSNYEQDYPFPQQSQYYEHSEGQLVPYTLGSTQQEQTHRAGQTQPRYVYDRLGQTYMENDGKLRLMAPRYENTAEPSNTEMIAEILNENHEVMDELNPNPDGRFLPKATELIKDAGEYIHDIARRDVSRIQVESSNDYGENFGSDFIQIQGNKQNIRVDIEKDESPIQYNGNEDIIAAVKELPSKPKNVKRRPKLSSEEKQNRKNVDSDDEESDEIDLKTQRMYQVMPFQQDDRDGSVIVKIFSEDENKDDDKTEKKTGDKKPKNGNKIVQIPKMQTVKKGDKEYDVLTIFEDPDTTSQEEVQRIIKHLNESKKSSDE